VSTLRPYCDEDRAAFGVQETTHTTVQLPSPNGPPVSFGPLSPPPLSLGFAASGAGGSGRGRGRARGAGSAGRRARGRSGGLRPEDRSLTPPPSPDAPSPSIYCVGLRSLGSGPSRQGLAASNISSPLRRSVSPPPPGVGPQPTGEVSVADPLSAAVGLPADSAPPLPPPASPPRHPFAHTIGTPVNPNRRAPPPAEFALRTGEAAPKRRAHTRLSPPSDPTPLTERQRWESAQGHHLLSTHRYLWCCKCGAISSVGADAKYLKNRCRGPPPPTDQLRRQREALMKGLDPYTKRKLGAATSVVACD
jgi:hypothetical protein